MQLITAGSGVLVDRRERTTAPAAPRDLWQLVVKHGAGRTFALVMLLVLLPVLLAIALAVKLSSPGKVLYRQRRVGRHGETFEILKFRSMRDAPAAGFVSAAGFVPAAGSAPGGVEGEDRRTAIGTFLRRTSLDELPQLLNVVRGDMCLVGPRPERPEFVARFALEIPGYGVRHDLRVGMTGLAQVRGLRGKTSIADRAAADAEYVQNWSIGLDLKILLRTFGAVLQLAE
jgi:lipopolysaccharide/colanic/teichoic acid biosynthesis glycosyltransferase